VSVQQLKQANQLKSDLIRVGQSLKIPSTSQVVASTVTTSSSTTVGSGESYKVVKGDTLTSIARRYSTTANKLAELNNISDPTRLRIGMMLKLPRQNVNGASTLEAENLSPQAKPFRAPVMNTDMAMLRPAENS
jgi:LysM repeat protein